MPTFAQEGKQINGKVVDEAGEPIIGVAVVVKSTQRGSTTNTSGSYELQGVSSSDVLSFSILGYKTQDLRVGNRTQINVTMVEDQTALDEVVVVGYQSQRKVDLTGSVSSISSDKLMEGVPFSTEQALKGKFAGVQVTNNDGAPGGGVTVKIRGSSSITAGTSPLYVVDGFPYPISDDPLDNPLSKISPEAIESISILKDVSSTAIYGAQGANGVVLITTKKGHEGKGEISFKASYGVTSLANGIEMLDAEGYMSAMMRDYSLNSRWQNNDFYEDYLNQIWITDPDRFEFYPDFCLQNGSRQNYEVSYRGGTERIQNSTVFSYSNEEGLAINTGYNRFYFQTNNNIKMTDKLSLNTNISYERSVRDGAFWTDNSTIFNDIQTFSPLVPKEWTFQEIDDNLYYTGAMDNPWRKLTDISHVNESSSFMANADLTWNVLDNLFIKGSFGTRLPYGETKEFIPETIQEGYENGGVATYQVNKGLNLRGAFQAGYNKDWNNGHVLNAQVVFEANSNEVNQFEQTYTHFNTDLGWEGIYSAESGSHVEAPTLWYEKVTQLSGVAMVNYSYDGKYLFKASLRADGSSKFAPSNRWGYFPSGAFAWRLSEESFFKQSDFLDRNVDNVKLRFSYGKVGNDQIDSYQYINTLSSGSQQAVFGDSSLTTYYSSRMMNSEIGWEVTGEFNLGLDIDMFDNRLNLTMDAYSKVTTDMLLDQHLPMTSGFDSVTRNVGSVGSQGFEISLGGRIIDKKDFSWSATINFSTNRTEVLSLGDSYVMYENRYVGQGNSTENVLIQEGMPLGLLYGMQIEGVRSNYNLDNNAVTSSSDWWWAPTREAPYAFVSFADINGDGESSLEDRTVIGCTTPKFIGGLNTNFRWKFIEVAMDFSWSYGNDVINGNFYDFMRCDGIDNRSALYYETAWFPTNTTGTFTPSGPISWSNYMSTVTTSEIVEDGSFLKLNNVALTYRMPNSTLKRLFKDAGVTGIALTYSINNVFCLTNYTGYDPEVSSGTSAENRILSGVDISSYPYSRSHMISLNLKF
ncbi:MAG: TonB-dependent receptor [Rikenellaceae bacterium]